MKSSALIVKVVQFIFLCIDTLHANVCRSTGGIVECCPGYFWNKIENRCIGCRAGTSGPRCDMPCPYPQYGHNCLSNCSCTEDHCDPADGCPDWTNKSTTFPQSTNIFISSVKMKNDLDSITKDVSTQFIHRNDTHTCQGIKTQKHGGAPLFRNMLTAIVTLFSLAVFMLILYTGLVRYKSKNTLHGPLSKNIMCYNSV
ncbi:uncharacterized protein LOC128183230 isoform X1 [Crassostrea angulata]|uniref:uncharacterized protein LOC128183230 isoform X1 n=1 Tax=Magallana angulata TaxID=2784310 RepID=UPI0022B182D5|nr:uncharacterized protein LOC128183230 isoform X1 [Crassostrea angulata]